MVEGVLATFRRRLSAAEGIAFVQVLPPMLRAMFVAGWEPEDAPRASWGRAVLVREIQALREHHNFAPDTVVDALAKVLRRHGDATAWAKVLDRLPPAARALWTDGAS